jgi:hypothetical protein
MEQERITTTRPESKKGVHRVTRMSGNVIDCSNRLQRKAMSMVVLYSVIYSE